jgi:hypothetical protein
LDLNHKETIMAKTYTFLSIFFLLTINNFAQISVWQPKGPGGGGALFSPSFSPHNTNDIYTSCDMSELFHSTDLGANWQLTDFKQLIGGVNSLVQFTDNPSILYCINYANDLMTPVKSTDAGLTWNNLASDPTAGDAYTLLADINNSAHLLLADYDKLYYSSNGGTSSSLKYTATGSNGLRIAGAFFDGGNIFAATNEGLLISTNSGSSFSMSTATGIPAGQAILSFAGAKQSVTTRFFCITGASADIYPGIPGSDYTNLMTGIYSMDLGVTNWTSKMTGVTNGTDFPFFVAMASNNISTAYLGGGSSNGDPIVFKTSNGGTSWQKVFNVTNNQNITTGWSGYGGDRGWSYGECAMGFSVAPFDANKVAITDFGFIHITTDGGANWDQKYVSNSTENAAGSATPKNKSYQSDGLENTTCWQVTWANSNTMIASFSDIRGVRSIDAGASWSFNYTGHSDNSMYRCFIHPVSSIVYAATSTVHDIYQSTRLTDATLDGGGGKVLFSSNNGSTWQTLHDFTHPVIWVAGDPTNANRLYASVIHSTAGGIYVSNNIQNGASSTWTKVTNPPRTEGHPFNMLVLNDGTLVCTYSGRRTTAFTASSGVFVSTNGGTSWIDRSHSGMLYWTKDIVVDPHDASQNTWYAGVFSGWGGPPNGLGGLYKTTNRGVSWTRISNLDRVTSCTISPDDPNEMYVTTETEGLWFTNNLTSPTPTFTNVSSYLFKQPERVFYNPYNTSEVWVTSFGNGMKAGQKAGPLSLHDIFKNSNYDKTEKFASIYPNPVAEGEDLILKSELSKKEEVDIRIVNLLQKEIFIAKEEMGAGSNSLLLNIPELHSGMYFIELYFSDKVEVLKLIVK